MDQNDQKIKRSKDQKTKDQKIKKIKKGPSAV